LTKKLGEEVYSYPDVEDKITSSFIRERTSSIGQWEKSEKKILTVIEDYVKKFPGFWLLDAGCGTGRLLPFLADYFDMILAIDRDPVQIRKAKDLARNCGFADKVVFETSSISEFLWRKASIDSIVCSHLLQHISTQSVFEVFQKFGALSKVNGTLFILTNHAKNQDYFVKQYLKDQKVVEEKICEEEFNSLVSNKVNILPIHFFSKDRILQVMKDSGYSLLDYRLFHKVSRTDAEQKENRDMLIVAQKQA
jgi:cyclopropane fatty-acyl-phospholipid synthase-like methyltransferase